MDLAAHCEESANGEYLYMLEAMGIAIRWCELAVLPNRSQHAVQEAIDRIQKTRLLTLGSDSDNVSVFLNDNLSWYCQSNG